MKTHCDTCDRRDLCDIINRGTAPCGENAGVSPQAATMIEQLHQRVAALSAKIAQTPPVVIASADLDPLSAEKRDWLRRWQRRSDRMRDIEPPPAEPWGVFAHTSDWDELLREIL